MKRYHRRPSEELYDLNADANEMHNLAGNPAHAGRVKQMRAELEAWMDEQDDQRTVFGTPK